MTAAGGNAVLNTGRPTEADARRAIGPAAISGAGGSNPDVQDPTNYQPGNTTRSAAGTTDVGTRGGGMAGTPAVSNDRTVDTVEGRAAGPEGNLAGRDVPPGQRAPADAEQTSAGAPQGWDRARKQSPKGQA